ncbi:hypothetical protein GB937_010733 [Aspergillus fischeri]|nr:hypothetical protein GB937_010733 [Aspergillus fischeri]
MNFAEYPFGKDETVSHSPKPSFFLPTSNSIRAKQSSGSSSWGDRFHSNSSLNYSYNSATTMSFHAGWDWAMVLSKVAKYKDCYMPYNLYNHLV